MCPQLIKKIFLKNANSLEISKTKSPGILAKCSGVRNVVATSPALSSKVSGTKTTQSVYSNSEHSDSHARSSRSHENILKKKIAHSEMPSR